MASKCRLGCGRKLVTHTVTEICSTCLANLAGWRRRPAAHRIRYRERLDLSYRRQGEIDKNPKGYRLTPRK